MKERVIQYKVIKKKREKEQQNLAQGLNLLSASTIHGTDVTVVPECFVRGPHSIPNNNGLIASTDPLGAFIKQAIHDGVQRFVILGICIPVLSSYMYLCVLEKCEKHFNATAT